DLARFYLFHTSSHWGITRQQVHIDEVLRLPFCLPESLNDPTRGAAIVKQVSQEIQNAASQAQDAFTNRRELIKAASDAIEPLLGEYFDILPSERELVTD